MIPVPAALDELLKPYPPEIQAKFREAIGKLHLQNPNDPIFELMMILGLWGSYYQKISGAVAGTGVKMEESNARALGLFDERVLMLEGIAQAMRQALERLEGVSGDIAERFPVEQVARAVLKKVDDQIQTLPLENFGTTIAATHVKMQTVANGASTSATKITTAAEEIERAARRIEAVKLPRLSWWGSLWLMVFGAVLAFGGMWWFSMRPEIKGVRNLLRNEAYIGNRASAGMQDGYQVIIIPTAQIESATRTNNDLDTVIRLKKEAP